MKRLFYIFATIALVFATTSWKANDYETASRKITANSKTQYEKARAIYAYLANNIEYDVSYTIYSADECWDKRTGTCQAYCELFLKLAEPAGLQARIVRGVSKNYLNKISDKGHSWLIASTEMGEILLDPTWGAGTVENKTFKKSDHDMTWFDVNPTAMIFTHFPNDPADQKLSKPLSKAEFEKIPSFKPALLGFGLNPTDILSHTLKGGKLPALWKDATPYIDLVEFPYTDTLRVGKTYEIKLKKKNNCEIKMSPEVAIKYAVTTDKKNITKVTFTIIEQRSVSLFVSPHKDKYICALTWDVAQPTSNDYKALQSVDPYLSPEWKKIDNMNMTGLRQHLLDPNMLLSKIESGELTSLPEFYNAKNIQIVSMPLTGTLQAGETYRFQVKNPRNVDIAMSSNNGRLTKIDNWGKKGNIYTIDYLVPASGKVSIAEKLDDGYFYPIVDFKATSPSAEGQERLDKSNPLDAAEIKALDRNSVYSLVQHGYEPAKLLRMAKTGKALSLPTFYTGGNYDIIDIPLTSTLKVGKPYTFKLKLKNKSGKWAIINSPKQWMHDKWSVSGDEVSITVTPENEGDLIVACNEDGATSYEYAILYSVEK